MWDEHVLWGRVVGIAWEWEVEREGVWLEWEVERERGRAVWLGAVGVCWRGAVHCRGCGPEYECAWV